MEMMKTILMMATTLDGKIAKNADHFPDWTGKEDKKLFVEITREAGVILMGSKTFDTIGKPLPGRKNVVLSRNKSRTTRWDNLVFTDRPPREILNELEKEGFSRVVLAGGAMVNALFARENLIDEIVVTISPKIFGDGVSLFRGEVSMEISLLEMKRLADGAVLLRYKVVKEPGLASCLIGSDLK